MEIYKFANKLKILMQDESLREKFGKNAKEKVQKEFSQEIIMQKWEKLVKFKILICGRISHTF